jgi:hypothetical protein
MTSKNQRLRRATISTQECRHEIIRAVTNIDAEQRLVYGVVTAEAPDISGEVCDCASATDGESFGNLRAKTVTVADNLMPTVFAAYARTTTSARRVK